MNAVEILSGLGFTNATALNEQRRGKVTVRVRTSNGWVYERFSLDNLADEIAAWANGRSPE